jgi:multicomponent Na+:H+ antiporter subunit D
MPVTFTCFTIGVFSMIGFPMTAGLVSKWFIIESAFSVETYVIQVVLIISTFLTSYYYLPIVYRGFFKKPFRGNEPFVINEAPNLMIFSIVFVAILNISVFISFIII